MGRDGLSMKLEGGAKLDKVLAKMAITQQSKTSTMVYAALRSGSNVTKKEVKSKAPVDKGTLRKSLINGTKRRVKTPRDVFLASVSFKFTREENSNKGTDGWHSLFAVKGTKNQHPNSFVKKGVKASESQVRKKIGDQLAKKIAKYDQDQINKL